MSKIKYLGGWNVKTLRRLSIFLLCRGTAAMYVINNLSHFKIKMSLPFTKQAWLNREIGFLFVHFF